MACEHEFKCDVGEPILTTHEISFSYERHQPILKSINMSIPAGKICGLFGPNGSGKSTLFKCCLNFLKPKQGEVRLFNKPLNQFSPAHLAQHIAYVPQEHHQAFPYTVREMVAMGRTPHLRGLPLLTEHDNEIIDHVLKKIGLENIAHQHYANLSGGQRQLVLVARAMAQQASLIFLDEPTSSLDFANQLLVWEALLPIAQEGVGIFICCHDPNHILWFCDDVIIIKEGELLAQGEAKSTLTQTMLQQLYGRKIAMKHFDNQAFIYFDNQQMK